MALPRHSCPTHHSRLLLQDLYQEHLLHHTTSYQIVGIAQKKLLLNPSGSYYGYRIILIKNSLPLLSMYLNQIFCV